MVEHFLCFVIVLLAIALYTNGQFTNAEIQAHAIKASKLPADICGESSEKVFERKIINGEPAELGAYPWMAAIGYKVGNRGPFWSCGGSLITNQYIVTAAHCLDPNIIAKKQRFVPSVVRLGDLNLNDSVADGASPTEVDIENYIYHPQYSNTHKLYDIGLIRLRRKVQFHDLLKPLCLPPAEFFTNTFTRSASVVIGWGKASFNTNARPPTHLQEAEVQVQDLDQCRRNITSVFPKAVINNSVVCASNPGVDSCQGDSGGPLMLYRRYRGKSRMYLLGVVSYGYSCAKEGYPGVYTRVSHHMKWLFDNMNL